MKPTEHVDEIMGKWREEAEQGRLVDPKSVLESHPEHADELAGRFAAQALVDDYFADADGLPLVTPELSSLCLRSEASPARMKQSVKVPPTSIQNWGTDSDMARGGSLARAIRPELDASDRAIVYCGPSA